MTREEILKLPHGTPLTLIEAVTNPKPDRRCTNDWRAAETIEKDRTFVVIRSEADHSIEIVPIFTWAHKCLYVYPWAAETPVGKYGPLVEALLSHFTVGKRSLATVARANHRDVDGLCAAVVRELMRRGQLTLDQIDTILKIDREEG